MKTKLTKKIEYLIFKNTTKLGVGGCREVKIGTHKTKSLLTGEQEFVDYINNHPLKWAVCLAPLQ